MISRPSRLTFWRGGRVLLALAALAMVAAPAAVAKLRVAVKEACSDVSLPIPDGASGGEYVYALTTTGYCPPREYGKRCGYGGLPVGARVLDVDLSVRVVHPAVNELTILVVSPVGVLTPLTVNKGGGADFGSGATGCTANFTTFDDSGPLYIGATNAANAPFPGAYQPDQPLAIHNGTFGSGDWRFYFDDTALGNAGTVEAVAMRIAYNGQPKKKKKKTETSR